MFDDPIVKEVRNARLEIENECGGDFRKIYERALEIQKGIGNGEKPKVNGLTPEILDSILAHKS